MDIIGRKVRRELQVELPDGGIGKELLVGTVTAYRYAPSPLTHISREACEPCREV
jgi:hypothetical protein